MTWMSGASRHWPDVREVMAMELLSWRITGTDQGRESDVRHLYCRDSDSDKITGLVMANMCCTFVHSGNEGTGN